MGAEGPCVVKRMGDGSLMAVCECLTMQSARMEAMRLNSIEGQDIEANERGRALHRAMAHQRASEYTTRAGVRFFPNEG